MHVMSASSPIFVAARNCGCCLQHAAAVAACSTQLRLLPAARNCGCCLQHASARLPKERLHLARDTECKRDVAGGAACPLCCEIVRWCGTRAAQSLTTARLSHAQMDPQTNQ
eukprot:361716-Chlamydomonas_euryale.AAC.5